MACGLAPSLRFLVAARFVQGAAAAVMMPASMALIRQAYPRSGPAGAGGRRSGRWAARSRRRPGRCSAACSTWSSWRLIFFLNVPVGWSRCAAGPQPALARAAAPFDWVGQITAVLAMGGLTYGAIEAGAAGFAAPRWSPRSRSLSLALAGVRSCQARGAHPMVPLDCSARAPSVIAVAIGFAFMVGYYGLPFVFSLYLQQHRGLSAAGDRRWCSCR